MKKKILGFFVCMLLIATAIPAVGTMNIAKSSQQNGRQDDYDWQVSGNNVFTGHGGSYPSENVGIGTMNPSSELHIEGGDGITAVRLVETTANDSVWELRAVDEEGDGFNQFGIWGGESGSEDYRFLITPGDGISMGRFITASGLDSIAMGQWTGAHGEASTAMGYYTTAGGHYSTAMGSRTTASGSGTTAMGRMTTASAYTSTAMGYGTTASGDFSTAMGRWTNASGRSSTAIGDSTLAHGDFSTAMGNSIIVEGFQSVGIGLDSTEYTVTPFNVMSIMGGNVGIGSTAPSYLLDVSGGSGIVAQFSGRVKGADAVNDDEFVTKKQIKSFIVSYYTPTGSSDSKGNVGDIAWDSDYFYVKTNDGWKRAALETWESTSLLTK